MKLYNLYVSAWREPVLIEDSFSWSAFLFGPVWLTYHRCWTATVLTLAAFLLIVGLTSGFVTAVLLLALELLIGLQGSDMYAWSLHERGYQMKLLFAAQDRDDALIQLLRRMPSMAEHFRPEMA